MAAKRLKTPAVPAAQTREEAEAAVFRIGEIRRELTRRETVLNDQVAAMTAKAEADAADLQADLVHQIGRVQGFCEANRKDLTNGGRTKTIAFATGEVKWRARPPKVSIRGVKPVLAYLLSSLDGRFVRTKFEIDKDAMLAAPAVAGAVPGVKIGSDGEDFVIEPVALQLAGAA